jgi:hypothetical protein
VRRVSALLAGFGLGFAGESTLRRLSLGAAAVIGGFGAWFIAAGVTELL